MKDTTKENMPREEAYNNSDVEAPKEETAISSEKELLSMLAKIFGIEGETPEALISSAKRKKARARLAIAWPQASWMCLALPLLRWRLSC